MSFDCLWAGTTFRRRGLRVLDDLLSNEFICPELVVEFIMVQLPWPAVRADLGHKPCAKKRSVIAQTMHQRWQQCQTTWPSKLHMGTWASDLGGAVQTA